MDRKIIIFSKFLNNVMTYEFNAFGDFKFKFVCWILYSMSVWFSAFDISTYYIILYCYSIYSIGRPRTVFDH